MCHSLTQGVAALFGPNSPYTAHHVQSICDSKEIPHIETRCVDMKLETRVKLICAQVGLQSWTDQGAVLHQPLPLPAHPEQGEH